MSARRWYVERVDGETGKRTQVGAMCKTPDKAARLRQQMRAQQPFGSSTWFLIKEGRKS